MKTYIPKLTEIDRRWWVVDAEGKVLGRLASEVAQILRGKHKPMFTTHLDVGDYVVVINADTRSWPSAARARSIPAMALW